MSHKTLGRCVHQYSARCASADKYHSPMTRDAPEQYGSTKIPSLTQQEKAVLQAIYDYFREHGTWPTFITIDRPIRRAHRWDTGAIILTLPESLIVQPRPGNLRPIERDELQLRLLGIQACDGSSDDTERFVRTLRWLAEQEEAYEPPPGSGDDVPQVTSQEVADYLGVDHAERLALKRLHAMLQLDHWGLGGSGSNDDSWYVSLGQDIWRFRDVHSVEDVVAAREAWLAEGRPPQPKASEPVQERLPRPEQIGSPYVDAKIVEAIRAREGQGQFDVTKLLALVSELNDNYASRHTYASHALLRAVLDHVPPAFGYANFREVANNYPWKPTDQRYMKKLADFRDQADDALHRQISAQADLLSFEDMPTSVCVDRLLQECAERL